MSRILSRVMLVACLLSTPVLVADEELPASPDSAVEEDAGEVVEPGRLAPSVEYYEGAAQGTPQGGQADLFYNYYATPGNPAAMYPAPYPTPPIVGHVYYTYQPFLPHEFLYPHFREYYTYKGQYHGYEHLQGGATYNKTTVRWTRGHAPLSWLPHKLHGAPRVPSIPTQRYPNH